MEVVPVQEVLIDGSFNVCDGADGATGPAGAAGFNGIIDESTLEPLCPGFLTGATGKIFGYGTDINGNGNLYPEIDNPGEVLGTFTVCNGADGAEGPPGISGYGTSTINTVVAGLNIPNGGTINGSNSCPSGKKVITGGCEIGGGTQFYLRASRPNSFLNPTAWYCEAINGGSTGSGSIDIRVLCANVE